MTITKKSVFVVIPNLNGVKLLGASIKSLQNQLPPQNIVIVDNASKDGSVSIAREHGVHVIELLQNRGFAGGVNVGIKYAMEQRADYIALFNNDAEANPDWLESLAGGLEQNPKVGIVTGKFMRIDKKHIDSTGDLYSSWGYPFPRGRDEIDKGQYDKQQEVFGATGGASLYRVDMLQQIGLFDEEFFAYYEDVDISFRAQLAGWKVLYQPKAVAYHHVGATSSKMGSFSRYHSIKNFFYLYAKNMPTRLYWKYLPKFLVGAFLLTANSLKRMQFIPLFKAYGELIVTIPSTAIKRWNIQKLRKVSARHIDSLLVHEMPPTQKSLLALRQKFRR